MPGSVIDVARIFFRRVHRAGKTRRRGSLYAIDGAQLAPGGASWGLGLDWAPSHIQKAHLAAGGLACIPRKFSAAATQAGKKSMGSPAEHCVFIGSPCNPLANLASVHVKTSRQKEDLLGSISSGLSGLSSARLLSLCGQMQPCLSSSLSTYQLHCKVQRIVPFVFCS